jgi:putative acetyltransferase
VRIETVESAELLKLVRELFVEYANSLGVDLCFQNFSEELAGLPGEYARPAGRLLLASENGHAIGCGAIRRDGEDVCEMKRLYVRPAARRKGVGIALIDELVKEARAIGYQRMRLDTLPSMTKAIAMYRALGFKEIAPYRYNPIPGSLFLELELTKSLQLRMPEHGAQSRNCGN